MIHTYALKRCPWCNVTPSFYMFIGCGSEIENTWLPEIKCKNEKCMVQPKTKYVPIRKRQRFDPNAIKEKIERLVEYWNTGNPMTSNEGFQMDFEEFVRDINAKLGSTMLQDSNH